uniref:Nucleoside diphosphate kinase-like domain-containing protein n=1 Tax=Cyprinus carpio TaxID=7962 RepID=A0A8C2E9L9_CYPCA
MRCVKALQLTLALVKPDAVAHPLILQALHQKILENFIIVRKKDLLWRTEESESSLCNPAVYFYSHNSGPMRAYILAREDERWRRPERDSTRRWCHFLIFFLSDSIESAKREISFFFPEFNADEWMLREEPCFRLGLAEYNEERQIHILQDT